MSLAKCAIRGAVHFVLIIPIMLVRHSIFVVLFIILLNNYNYFPKVCEICILRGHFWGVEGEAG